MSVNLFGPPPNISLSESLHLIFSHYCSPWKSPFGNNQTNTQASTPASNQTLTMDGASFSRMCREAPDLDKFIGRTEIDLIFSKTKGQGIRRLNYDHFLDTLLELSVRIYPDEDPIVALSNFLSRFIFALFDQPPSPLGVGIIDQIIYELQLPALRPAQNEAQNQAQGFGDSLELQALQS